MSNKIHRNRTQGNFLFHLYSKAELSNQLMLKAELLKISAQTWENFLRTQSNHLKKSGFDAEIIGVCVKHLVTDESIRNDTSISDLTKLNYQYAQITFDIESMV